MKITATIDTSSHTLELVHNTVLELKSEKYKNRNFILFFYLVRIPIIILKLNNKSITLCSRVHKYFQMGAGYLYLQIFQFVYTKK